MNLQSALNEIDTLRAEITRLRAIVERLPKTADGVPVTPGMLVWDGTSLTQTYDDGSPYTGFRVNRVGSEIAFTRQRKSWVDVEGLGEITTDNLYSTRAAALAAKGAANDDHA